MKTARGRRRRRSNEHCDNYNGVLLWCNIYCNHNDARPCHPVIIAEYRSWVWIYPAAPGSAAPPATAASQRTLLWIFIVITMVPVLVTRQRRDRESGRRSLQPHNPTVKTVQMSAL